MWQGKSGAVAASQAVPESAAREGARHHPGRTFWGEAEGSKGSQKGFYSPSRASNTMGGAGNAAVVAVGRTFFRITMLGYTLAGLAMFPAVILGLKSGFFEWEMDRCTCVPEVATTSTAGVQECTPGLDMARVTIGWQKYSIKELKHTLACPTATNAFDPANPTPDDVNLDDPRSFGLFKDDYWLDGEFQKTDNPTQADEDNGGAEAGGGVVAMQVVLTFFSIFTYKMLKASYVSNGSHCSVGLGLMTRLNLLMGLGTVAALVSFWWLIEGRFGDEDKALTTALEDVSLNYSRDLSAYALIPPPHCLMIVCAICFSRRFVVVVPLMSLRCRYFGTFNYFSAIA